MEYKGYYGSVKYSDEDGLFHGRVEFIRALVSFEGSNVRSLKSSFKEAVEDYLELCSEKAIEPEKAFKGSFNVRPGAELHRSCLLYTSPSPRDATLSRMPSSA